MDESTSGLGPVEALAEEFVTRLRRGERPTVEDYAARYPALADEILAVFPALALVEDLKPDPEGTASHPRPTGPDDGRTSAGRLGDYRILREVGRGGMGVVYEAEQVSLGRHVALKVLPMGMIRDPRLMQRFEREARSAARLHHTNIVPVYETGQEGDVRFYAMQLIRGQGLDLVVEELRRLRDGAGEAARPGPGPRPDGAGGSGTDSVATGRHPPGPGRHGGEAWRSRQASGIARSILGGQAASKGGAPAAPPARPEGVASPHGPDRPGGTIAAGALTDPSAVGRLAGPALAEGDTGPDSPSSGPAVLPDGTQIAGVSSLERGPAFYRSVARIGRQVAEALTYAHAQGIVHRDIKPSNLLLDQHGTVWVADFGLAKVEGQQDLTHTGDVLGTLRYMAPELFEGRVDGQSDVYSLGLTLYELIALRPAFDAKGRGRLARQVTAEAPPRLRGLCPGVPLDLETIIHKAIKRDPAQRYGSASELSDDLRRFLDDRPIRARRASSSEHLVRWCRRNPALAGSTVSSAVLVVALAIGATAAAFVFRRQRDEVRGHQARAERAEREEGLGRIASLMEAAPENVLPILKESRLRRGQALPELRRRLDAHGGALGRLRAAEVLTSLGDPHPDVLVDSIPTVPAPELRNLAEALDAVRGPATGPLLRRAAAADPTREKGRLAAVLLRLGEPGPARELLRLRPDPAARVAFIRRFPEWRVDLSGLPVLLREVDDGDFTGGMCLAIAGVEPAVLSVPEREGLTAAMLRLYRDARDGATHSAAAHALRRWDVALPPVATSPAPLGGRRWFVNARKLTMLEVPDGEDASGPGGRRPYFLADREVSVDLFRAFAADTSLAPEDRPREWAGPNPETSPTGDCPVDSVSWPDAVRFCNWLSSQDGRSPAYERDGPGPRDWLFLPDANGYRLTTEAEWVLAFRAGTTTRFPTGEQPDLLAMMAYGNVDLMKSEPCGRRIPNGWGYFDMLGNVWEFSLRLDSWPSDVIPLHGAGGGGGPGWVQRGSSFGAGSFYSGSDVTMTLDASSPHVTVGFRVACGPLTPRGSGPRAPAGGGRAGDPRTWLGLGRASASAGRVAEAASAFGRALDLSAGEPPGDWWGGPTGLADEAAADPIFAALLAARPGDPRLLTARVRCLIGRGEWGAAADALETLLGRRRDWLSADDFSSTHDRIGLAALRALAGDRAGHQRLLRAAHESSDAHPAPAMAMLVNRIGVLAPGDDDGDAAVARKLERALRGPLPDRANWPAATLYTLGAVNHRAGRPQQSLEYCRRSIETAPRWEGMQLNWPIMAMDCQRLGRTGEARELLGKLNAYIAEKTRARPPGDQCPPPGVNAINWLELLALAREAEAVIVLDPAFPDAPLAGGASVPSAR